MSLNIILFLQPIKYLQNKKKTKHKKAKVAEETFIKSNDPVNFEFEADGSIFANQELSKHTKEKIHNQSDSYSNPKTNYAQAPWSEYINTGDYQTANSGRTIDSRERSSYVQYSFGLMSSKRKSFERCAQTKAPLLPMLLKFKHEGKGVDLSKSNIYSYKRMSTAKCSEVSPKRKMGKIQENYPCRETSFDRVINHIISNENEDQFTQTVKETFDWLNLNNEQNSSK